MKNHSERPREIITKMNVAVFLLFGEEEDNEQRQSRHLEFRRLKLERKRLRDGSNPFTLDPEFFRMPPALAMHLADTLQDHIRAQGASHVPIHLQVLAALRFFAEGSYQKGVSQDYKHPLERSTFGRFLHRVVIALSSIAPEWIKFPETMEDRQRVKNRFLQNYRIPGIIGLIDCTVVNIIRPSRNEEAFFTINIVMH